MPTFLPISPVIRVSQSVNVRLLQLDLDIHSRRYVKLAQRINGLLSWLQYIEKTLVCPNLKLVPGFLVHVGGAIHCKTFDPCRKGDRPGYSSTGASHRLDDFPHRLVQDAVVVCFQANPDFLVHASLSDLPSNLAMIPSATVAGTGS